MENENLVYLINKRNEIIENQKLLEKNFIFIEKATKYDEAFYQDTINSDYAKEEYRRNNELLQGITSYSSVRNFEQSKD